MSSFGTSPLPTHLHNSKKHHSDRRMWAHLLKLKKPFSLKAPQRRTHQTLQHRDPMEDTRFGVAATSAPSPLRYPNLRARRTNTCTLNKKAKKLLLRRLRRHRMKPHSDVYHKCYEEAVASRFFTWVACLVIGSTTSTSPACTPGLERSLCRMANLCGSKRLTQKPFTVSFLSKSKVARVWWVKRSPFMA